MMTLPDPKHEAFATLLASGHDLAAAYVHAGYSVKNIKQRSRKLLKNPNIQARIAHLKTCLPRIEELHKHHCPSLRLMPETRHEMLVWLWQVMNGSRLVRPAQMRAVALYCRMRGWHIAKLTSAATQETPASSTLTDAEQALLAMSNRENIAHEQTGMPRPVESLARIQSLMADQATPICRHDTLGRPIPSHSPDSEPAPVAASAPTNVPTTASVLTLVPRPSSVPPALSGPTPNSPHSRDGVKANPASPSEQPVSTPPHPPSNPHPKPLTLNRLNRTDPQPRTFLKSPRFSERAPLSRLGSGLAYRLRRPAAVHG